MTEADAEGELILPGGGGAGVLSSLSNREGVRAAALVDEAGRILDQFGFSDQNALSHAAPLGAVLHHTCLRLGVLTGRRGRGAMDAFRLALSVDSDTVLMEPVVVDGSLWNLFVVLDAVDEEGPWARVMEPVVRAIRAEYAGVVAVPASVEFEESLLERLDRVFSFEFPDGPGNGVADD